MLFNTSMSETTPGNPLVTSPLKLVAVVDGDKNAEVGGLGIVASIKRFPDRVENY